MKFSGPGQKGPENLMVSLSMQSAETQTTEFIQ